MARALAAASTQVHVRSAGAAATHSITSVPETLPIQNLRAGYLLNNNTSVDWASKASVQAKLRLAVKAVLKRMGYPPDGQDKATLLVLEQAKALGINLSGEAANDEARGVSSAPPSTGCIHYRPNRRVRQPRPEPDGGHAPA